MTVVLLLVTPYFEEWYRLREDKQNVRKKRFVYLSKDAYSYRLEAVTNINGEFTFPGMKPGRYFLQGMMDYAVRAHIMPIRVPTITIVEGRRPALRR